MTKRSVQQVLYTLKNLMFYSYPIKRRWNIALLLLVLLLLAVFSVNEKHLWRLDWRTGFHAWYNCKTVTNSHGQSIAAWRWVEGREIRMYIPYGMTPFRVNGMVDGVQGLVDELHLDLHVRVLPLPARVATALRHSAGAGHADAVNFERLCRELITTRDGRYAEIIITPCTLDDSADTLGMSDFRYGVAVLDARVSGRFLARHETGHLLGYHMHDDLPFIVLGYEDHEIARTRRARNAYLMMPQLGEGGDQLSPRSRDALAYFWVGLETHTHQHFFLR